MANKAILVIDEPVSNNGECPCRNCLLHVVEYDDYFHHYICQSERTPYPDEWEIYKKCPLMPIKMARYETIGTLVLETRKEEENE